MGLESKIKTPGIYAKVSAQTSRLGAGSAETGKPLWGSPSIVLIDSDVETDSERKDGGGRKDEGQKLLGEGGKNG